MDEQLSDVKISEKFTIGDLVEQFGVELRRAGWHIISDKNGVHLCRLSNRGRPKRPDVKLVFVELETSQEIDFTTGSPVNIKRTKSSLPWKLRVKSKITISYDSVENSCERFIEYAELLAPIKSKISFRSVKTGTTEREII